jgi:hypothetical protein
VELDGDGRAGKILAERTTVRCAWRRTEQHKAEPCGRAALVVRAEDDDVAVAMELERGPAGS